MNKRRMIKTQEGRRKKTFFRKIFTSHFIARVRKGCSRLHVRGCWRANINLIFWPHCYDRHVVSFLFSWCWGQLHRGFPRAPSVGCGLPYHIWSLAVWNSTGNCPGTQTQLSWIITQRPHDRPLDLWNRMFNRHQAEITVMQFRGYSLPVHHCSGTMGPSPCPHLISLNPPTRSLLISGHWNVSLPSGVSPWNSIFGPGRGSKYNTGHLSKLAISQTQVKNHRLIQE